MYIVKTKYSLETNIEPLSLLEQAKELNVDTLLIADDGPYAWLEIEKLNHEYNINILYSIEKENNGVKLLWIPRGNVLIKVANLEKAYRTNDFSCINKEDFEVILVPNQVAKKEIIKKELDKLRWLKNNVDKVYILERRESIRSSRILKEKSGVHTLKIKEIAYLDPTEREVSLMRKAIKVGKLVEDDYRSYMLPLQFLKDDMNAFEFNRTKRFFNNIKQEFIVEGHKNFKEKKMEYWNLDEIKHTPIPDNWNRFFGREIKIPESSWEQKKIALLCYKAGFGFNERYGSENKTYAIARLKHELSVIVEKGFYTYFLMVADFIRYCRIKNIRVGRGRGSVVGSVLAYCLDIIEIDPITYELKFERFLNPYRSNKPDIDVDLPASLIYLLFDYVKEKYGTDCVSKILTFNTFGVINAIQSVKNIFGINERIETWFPKGLDNLDEFLETAEGKKVAKRLEEKGYSHILDYVNGIASLPQAISIHPAGVIISQELNELPLIKRDGELVLAFTKQDDQVERLGVTKFDFLKVKTLDITLGTEKIRKKLGKPVYKLDFNDQKTFDLYRSGKSVGVFQMKSQGMRKTCQEVMPSSIEDLMDILSLYRPGPMEEIPRYVENKTKGYWSFEKLDPSSPEFKDIVPILDKTHGIITYQEQILEMASVWAGYALGEADLLRRAISGKKRSLLEAERKKFIERSIANGRELEITEYIYYLIEKFSDYGFNRSHAGGYAVFSFETAFQKAHYPVEFMTSSMNVSIDNRKKLKVYLDEVRNMNIKLLKPDLFKSNVHFEVTKNGEIQMGLAAIAGVGAGQASKIKQLISKKQVKTFLEAKELLKEMSGRTMDILIRAGVFDCFGDRYQIWQSVKDKKNQKPLNGQNPTLHYIDWEQELLQYTFSNFNEIIETLDNEEYVIESVSPIKDKKGRKMAFLKVARKEDAKELVVYYNVWANFKDKLSVGAIITPQIKDQNIATSFVIKSES